MRTVADVVIITRKGILNMKTIILVSLSIVLVFALILGGCAAPAPTPTPTPSPTPIPTPTPTAKPPIKIGHIRSITGPTAITNAAMIKGFDLAMELCNYEIAGRKVEVILEDDAIKPELAVDKARKLVEKDKVDVIVGPTLAGLQLAVANYCNQVGVPNINTNISPYGIIAQKFKWTIQSDGSNLQVPSAGGRYTYEKRDMKSATVIGEDTAAGHDYIGAFLQGFKKAGGQVIQEQWTPQGCPDYAPYFTAAKTADVCIGWVSGNDSIKFLNQYYEYGLWDKMKFVPAFSGAIIEVFILAQMQPKAAEACLGLISSVNYTAQVDTEANKKFVEAFKKKYNSTPDAAENGAYCGVLLIKAALEATGGDTTPRKFMDAMVAATPSYTMGTGHYDKEKQSLIRDVPVSKIEKFGPIYGFGAPIFYYKDVPPEGL
jgi:branched-chain amino acid transport system substrate-binding protein